jgi:hypothetical protein
MNPAQKALMEKIARMKAGQASAQAAVVKSKQTEEKKEDVISTNSQGNVNQQETVQQSPQVQETSEPEEQSGNPISNEGITSLAETKTTETTKPSSQQDHPIKMQLAELAEALEQKQPGFKTILRDIHGKLRQDPDIVTALSDEEIGGILSAMKHHAQVDIIAPKAVKAAKKTLKNVGADDL